MNRGAIAKKLFRMFWGIDNFCFLSISTLKNYWVLVKESTLIGDWENSCDLLERCFICKEKRLTQLFWITLLLEVVSFVSWNRDVVVATGWLMRIKLLLNRIGNQSYFFTNGLGIAYVYQWGLWSWLKQGYFILNDVVWLSNFLWRKLRFNLLWVNMLVGASLILMAAIVHGCAS